MPLTYLFSGDKIIYFEKIAEILNAAGWVPAVGNGILSEHEKNPPEYVDLLYSMIIENPVPHMAKNTYSIRSKWQNNYNSDSKSAIDNKFILHKNFSKTNIVTVSLPLSEFIYLRFDWIARPAGKGYHSGKGIKYINDIESWRDAQLYYENIPDVVVSKVIKNPLLLEQRKFHIRLYMFICAAKGVVKVSPFGEIYTAKLPYIKSDWQNMDIHDSHHDSTPRNYVYPEDFPQPIYLPIINVQLKQFERELIKYVTEFKPFSTSENAFELFAIDVMVQKAGYIHILEVNSRIGLPDYNPESLIKLAEWTANLFLNVFAHEV